MQQKNMNIQNTYNRNFLSLNVLGKVSENSCKKKKVKLKIRTKGQRTWNGITKKKKMKAVLTLSPTQVQNSEN